MAGDCEMVGVLILGIQSLDRAGQASCQSLQFVTVGPCGSGQTVQKSGMCLPGSPLGHSWGGADPDPPDVIGEGGGIPVVTPHLTPQIRADISWVSCTGGRQWTIKECDHQFDLSGLTGASRVRLVSSSVWQCRVSVCDIWSQPQSPPCHTLTHHTLCQLSQNILYTRLCLSWWASQLQAAPHSDIWGLSFVWLGSMSIPTLSQARFEELRGWVLVLTPSSEQLGRAGGMWDELLTWDGGGGECRVTRRTRAQSQRCHNTRASHEDPVLSQTVAGVMMSWGPHIRWHLMLCLLQTLSQQLLQTQQRMDHWWQSPGPLPAAGCVLCWRGGEGETK